MASSLDISIQWSDLFEATGYEGTSVSEMFDTEILPLLKTPLHESDLIGIGKKFSQSIQRVRDTLNKGGDRIRTLKDMMKAALVTYVQRTNDALTGRDIFHRAIKSGGDTMLTVTGAAILANALAGSYKQQAEALMQGIARQMSGEQPRPMAENSSGSAVSAGSIAIGGAKKKKRKDSIFAETASWDDLQDIPDAITVLESVVSARRDYHYGGIIVDPATAELVLAVHDSLAPSKKIQYANRPMVEMIEIAHRAVQRGLISLVLE